MLNEKRYYIFLMQFDLEKYLLNDTFSKEFKIIFKFSQWWLFEVLRDYLPSDYYQTLPELRLLIMLQQLW